jgi:hypothetical protein
VVRGEIPPYALVAGNPARVVRSLKEDPPPSTADGLVEAAPTPMKSA